MKRNQIILISIFVLISGLIYLRISANKKTPIKELKSAKTILYIPISKVKNRLQEVELVSYGQVAPNTTLDISFEVQGLLEKGDILVKPGVKFKANQLLFKVNQEESFYALSAKKAQLSNLLVGAMPDIELDFITEKSKWLAFLDALLPENRLPELPKFRSPKERMFITARGILSEYFSIKSQEARMEKYFYLAPFNGTVLEVFSEPGSVVNPGARIAKIARTGDLEVKVPIALAVLKNFQKEGKAAFMDANNHSVGSGEILRVSDVVNQRTQSVDVYYAIRPVKNEIVYNGQFVNVSIKQSAQLESFTVPRLAVKNNKVSVLNGNDLIEKEIVIVGNKPDSLFISGLNDGDKVVLEQVERSKEVKMFKGIIR